MLVKGIYVVLMLNCRVFEWFGEVVGVFIFFVRFIFLREKYIFIFICFCVVLCVCWVELDRREAVIFVIGLVVLVGFFEGRELSVLRVRGFYLDSFLIILFFGEEIKCCRFFWLDLECVYVFFLCFYFSVGLKGWYFIL